MAKSLPLYDQVVPEEEYIDMDIINSSVLCYTISSPPHSKEFEFKMTTTHQTDQRESSTSPADELFYKGKLLPLHLPPRLRMVQMLLQQTTTTTASPTTPSDSSEELNPEDLFSLYRRPNKSWSRRLNLGLKLKASRAYLKSLFNPTAAPGRSICEGRQIDEECVYRRSFSDAISTTKSSLCSDASFREVPVLKRSSSINSELESSIQGAISYCKRSQQQVGFFSLTGSRKPAVCHNKENPGICRG